MSRSLQVSTAGHTAGHAVGRVPARTTSAYDGGALRVTRRGRLLVVLLLVALLTSAFAVGRASWAGSTSSEAGSSQAQLVPTTVQPGDTLWAVAARLAPGVDPREVVAQIKEINDLTSGELQVGQQLLLPAAA